MSVFNITVNGEKQTETTDIPDHDVAVKAFIKSIN